MEAAHVAASLAAVVGLVVQDSVADALTTEALDRTGPDDAPRDPAAEQAESGDVQVFGASPPWAASWRRERAAGRHTHDGVDGGTPTEYGIEKPRG